jgi:hypothetical protein
MADSDIASSYSFKSMVPYEWAQKARVLHQAWPE